MKLFLKILLFTFTMLIITVGEAKSSTDVNSFQEEISISSFQEAHTYDGSDMDGANVDFKGKYSVLQQTIKDRYSDFEVPYNGKDNDDYVNGQGFCCDDNVGLRAGNDNPELFQYYYHSDHLGSTSLITDLDGNIVQHVEYVPFGEVFIEERNNNWNTPYLFNAKELDEETGLYYYGARYYDPRVSLWLGTDPMQEKYPNVSTYAYCANNSLKFVDPTGMSYSEFDENGNYLRTVKDNWWHNTFVGRKGRIVDGDGKVTQNFKFADPKNDLKDLKDGKINKVQFVQESEIISMLSKAGAFTKENKTANSDSRYGYILEEGKGSGKFDFSFTGIPYQYPEASPNPQQNPSSMLFLVDGVAHNHMNFGNFLFGAAGKALGLTLFELQMGAQYNSLANPKENNYKRQLDSSDDQFSIKEGVQHANKHNYKKMYYGVTIGW
jgi:RHS repeat-associated protein